MDPSDKQIQPEFLYGIFVLFFIVAYLLDISDPIAYGVSTVFTPLYSVGAEIGGGIRNTSDTITSLFDIRNERNDLLVENALLKARVAGFQMLQDELDTLKAEYGLEQSLIETVQASVLSWGYGNISGNIIINKGNSSKIEYGDTVTIGSIYLGSVSQVTEGTATVILPTNNRSTLEVLILPYRESFADLDRSGLDRIIREERAKLWSAVASGENGSVLLENIPKNSNVKVGDHVVISDKRIPELFYLGDITKVIVDPTDVQIKAVVTQPIDIKNITKVFVQISDE